MKSEFLLNGEAQEAFPWSQGQDKNVQYFQYCLNITLEKKFSIYATDILAV